MPLPLLRNRYDYIPFVLAAHYKIRLRLVEDPQDTIDAQPGWHEAPACDCALHFTRGVVAEHPRSNDNEWWVHAMHETAHLILLHPREKMSGIPECAMTVWEAQAVHTIAGPKARAAYLNTGYTRETRICHSRDSVRVESSVGDWAKVRESSWWEGHLEDLVKLKLLDPETHQITWRKPYWRGLDLNRMECR